MLRAIGYDTLWDGPTGFGGGGRRHGLKARIERARKEGRVFVSDDEIVKGVQGTFYVGDEEELKDRFRKVVQAFQLRLDGELLTRCTQCNGPRFEAITKEDAHKLRPDVVAEVIMDKIDEFFHCPQCAFSFGLMVVLLLF